MLSRVLARNAAILFLSGLLLGTSALPSPAGDTDPALRRTQAMMDLLSGGASVDHLVNLAYQQSVAALVEANPERGDAVQSFVDEQVLPEIRAAVPAMMTTLAGGYAQYFTEAEIEQIVAFYQSPVGQKLRRARPALMRETLQFGQLWAAQTLRAALTKLKPQLEAQGLKAPDI